jgi:hypothetical protein
VARFPGCGAHVRVNFDGGRADPVPCRQGISDGPKQGQIC